MIQRDLLIPLVGGHLTNLWKGHVFTIPKGSAELPGLWSSKWVFFLVPEFWPTRPSKWPMATRRNRPWNCKSNEKEICDLVFDTAGPPFDLIRCFFRKSLDFLCFFFIGLSWEQGRGTRVAPVQFWRITRAFIVQNSCRFGRRKWPGKNSYKKGGFAVVFPDVLIFFVCFFFFMFLLVGCENSWVRI